MAQTLASVALSTLVTINEGGSPVEFVVAKHNYESGRNGAGRTLLLRNTYSTIMQYQTQAINYNDYDGCLIDSYLNGEYKQLLPADVQSAMGTTKIPYTYGGSAGPVMSLERAIFILSLFEMDGIMPDTKANKEGSPLPSETLTYLRPRIADNEMPQPWTRTPHQTTANYAFSIDMSTLGVGTFVSNSCYIYPSFTLPSDTTYVTDDGAIVFNQEPSTPGEITVPVVGTRGEAMAVSWTASTDPDGNLSGYTLQRKVNSGSWTEIYKGSALSYQDTLPDNASSVQYRVQAYDTLGLVSGWKTSGSVPVYGVPVLTVPQIVMQGQSVSVRWSPITGDCTYTLQRKANTDTDWVQVYSGPNLTFSETAGTWSSVQYRVRGVISGVNGGWSTSGSIPGVDTGALVISGQDGSLGVLVNDVPYTITTNTGNPVTATIIANGSAIFSGTVSSGEPGAISIYDLDTGSGTIVIRATVQASEGTVSATRTWTYSKATITFPQGGAVAQLKKQGINIFPKTLLECVRGAERLAPAWDSTQLLGNAPLGNISSPGWYRICTATAPNGAGLFHISHSYNSGGPSDLLVYANFTEYGTALSVISSRYYKNVFPIDDLRITKEDTSDTFHLDIHYAISVMNSVGLDAWVTSARGNFSPKITLQSMAPVDDAPAGETVLITAEWISPPMSIGVEYRTVERYLDKPVYIKLVNCGTFAAPGTTKTVTFDNTGTLSRIVDFGGEIMESGSVWAFPTFLYGSSYEDSSIVLAEARVTGGNGLIYLYTKTRDLTSNSSYVWVKYTKNTD